MVHQPNWGGGVSLPVELTRQQIENAPPVTADKPVSRQQENELADYYDWPKYWKDVTFLDARAAGMRPEAYVEGIRRAAAEQEAHEAVMEKTLTAEETADPHLRSINEITGYYIQATDGQIGHVEELIADTESWTIRYLVIDTKNWWPAKKVLVATDWVTDIDWRDSKIHLDLKQDEIKNSPEYDPSQPVNREYESRLFDYYGRPKYWA